MSSLDAMNTAISGLQSQAFALQNISGNIANASTTGFKSNNTGFEDMLDSVEGAGSQVSTFVEARSVSTYSIQGSLQPSTMSTYMAINGNGYFTVEEPSGMGADGTPAFTTSIPAYTRRGDFQLDGNGYLINGAGNYLMGSPIDPTTGAATNGTPQLLRFDTTTSLPILGTLQSLSISAQGRVQGTYSNGQTVDVASLPLATFNGEGFLQQQDGGAYTPTVESGAALYTATGAVVGNALEASNTDIGEQMTTMIMTQQAYSANTRVVTTTSEMMLTLTKLSV
jgi:flagellar hook protein FlgE